MSETTCFPWTLHQKRLNTNGNNPSIDISNKYWKIIENTIIEKRNNGILRYHLLMLKLYIMIIDHLFQMMKECDANPRYKLTNFQKSCDSCNDWLNVMLLWLCSLLFAIVVFCSIVCFRNRLFHQVEFSIICYFSYFHMSYLYKI